MNKFSILLLAMFLLYGCDQQNKQETKAQKTATPTRSITVEVSQGTNMAAAVSPDGQTIVMSLQGTLFSLSGSGGVATRITDSYFDAREPAWSADGERIVFQGYRGGNWDLWEIDADGKNPRTLTDDPFDDREAMYSPVNNDVVFSSDRSGNYDIWLLSNGQLKQLSDAAANDHSPAWSSDGTRIAYAHALSARSYEVRVQDLTTGETTTVASDSGRIEGIAWKPDGSAVSYRLLTISPAESTAIAILKVMDIDSGQSKLVSSKDADVFPFRASWLNNDTLVYTAAGEIRKTVIDEIETTIPFSASFELNRKPYDRRQRQYDSDEQATLGIVMPVVSNDGKRIVFSALGDLWLTNTETQETMQITNDPYADQSPIFSPDATRIAFISDRTGEAGIWIHNLEQNTATQLADTPPLSGISWSPDGKLIAGFASIPGNPLGSQLTTVNIETGERKTYYKPISAQQTSWSGDSKYLATTMLAPYSSRYREGVYQLLRINLETGETSLHAGEPHKDMLNAVLSADGESFTFVQEGMLWRAPLDNANKPEQLTTRLTDTPSWSANNEHLVYMSADEMVLVSNGKERIVAHGLTYKRHNPDKRWVLRVGKLFDGINDRYTDNIDIIIDGNRITSIAPSASHDLEIVDMSDKTVIPGLFEMHAHMGGTSEAQGRTWLSYGVTSVRDPGSQPYVAKARQESWDSGRRVGPRTHVTGYLADGNRVFYSVAEGIASADQLEKALDRTRRLQLDFIKTYVRLPDEWQRRVVEAAHEMGIPTSSHEIFPAVSHGMDHVEHFGGTSRRGYAPKISQTGYMYGDVIELLAASGMGITPTVVFPGFALVVLEEKDLFQTEQFETFYGAEALVGIESFAKRMAVTARGGARANGQALRALVDAGALVVTGTDSPFVPYATGLHAELRLYVRGGLTPFETLRAATYSSATAAGVIDDTGTIEIGKLADLVVIDGDPLNDIKDTDNVVMTVKNGVAYSLAELLSKP